MSLDKSIKQGKDHRKPYQGSAKFDRSCRTGGDCPHCIGNRTHANRKRIAKADADIKEQ